MDDAERLERGRELEGYAFTFCKAAALALILRRYNLLVTSAAAAGFYVAAARCGVKEWRCFVKPPWVVIAFSIVAVNELRLLRSRT
jgi:uncharacterized protein (DUF169 family)